MIKGPIKMKSRNWECPKCFEIYRFDEPRTNPAPCDRCGSILLFKAVSDEAPTPTKH